MESKMESTARDDLMRNDNDGEEQELATPTYSNSSDEGDAGKIVETSKKVSQSELIALESEDSANEPKECQSSSLVQPMDGKKYEGILWVDLPANVKEALMLLGYTQEMWDDNKEPDACNDKYWEDLNFQEKEAAKVLGYDEMHWNFGNKEVTPEDYDDMYWNQLPGHIRKAYRVLGHNKKLWNDDGGPPSFDKDWYELTEVEQRAAAIVGFTEDTWDDDPEIKTHGSTKEESAVFIRGACYILLECISLSAFTGIIKMVYSFGKQFLNDHALNAFKIIFGLFIMKFSGQMHRWMAGEEEKLTNGKKEQPSLFRSFLNLFSWWTIMAGVEHFMSAFENDMLYIYADSQWYLDLCDPEDSMANKTLTNATTCTADNMTCTSTSQPVPTGLHYVYQFILEDLLIDPATAAACALLDDEREALGPVYYFAIFFGSAASMWYVFKDNFLQGCDTD